MMCKIVAQVVHYCMRTFNVLTGITLCKYTPVGFHNGAWHMGTISGTDPRASSRRKLVRQAPSSGALAISSISLKIRNPHAHQIIVSSAYKSISVIENAAFTT